ncbi:MAG: alpha/beta fold hydrolase [Arenicellales bacterium]
MKNFHSLSKVERRAFPGAQATYSDLPAIPRSEIIWLTSNDDHGDWITGLFAQGDPARKQCLIHFYAGNENLGKMGSFIETCRSHGLSVLMFDYRGYGASRGRPRESAFYSDAKLIYEWLHERYPDYGAIVSGRALGTAVAIYLAQHFDVRGLILLSPFTSMMEVVSDIFPKDEIVIEEAMPFVFDNLDRIRKVRCPILMVTASEDATAPRHMIQELEAAVRTSLTRLDVPSTGHQDLLERGGDIVWEGIFNFIDKL